MNKLTAIFFTVLYSVFLCFAVLGVFAANGQTARCAAYPVCVQAGTNEATTAEQEGWSHSQLAATHFIIKQQNSSAASNKYLYAGKGLATLLQQAINDYSIAGSVYATSLLPASCPLFILHQSLLL